MAEGRPLFSTYTRLARTIWTLPGVDHSEQGRGLGKALLKDALLRASQAADIISARAVLVHAIDPDAKAFYQRFGFEETPVDPLHLMMLMKALRANFRTVPAEGSR